MNKRHLGCCSGSLSLIRPNLLLLLLLQIRTQPHLGCCLAAATAAASAIFVHLCTNSTGLCNHVLLLCLCMPCHAYAKAVYASSFSAGLCSGLFAPIACHCSSHIGLEALLLLRFRALFVSSLRHVPGSTQGCCIWQQPTFCIGFQNNCYPRYRFIFESHGIVKETVRTGAPAEPVQ
jgi:hypothetical protein